MYIIFLLLIFAENISTVRKYVIILSLFFTLAFMVTAQNADAPDHSDATNEGVELWADEANLLHIRNGDPGTKIVIYSIVGTKMSEFELKTDSSEIPLQLPKGYYIVKIGEVARKVAVK